MRYPTHPEPTAICRCHQCGDEQPMGCGNICADCSWEDHLASMARTGSYDPGIHEATPTCCRAAAEAFEDARHHYLNQEAKP